MNKSLTIFLNFYFFFTFPPSSIPSTSPISLLLMLLMLIYVTHIALVDTPHLAC